MIKGAVGAFILRGNLAAQEFSATLHDRQLSETAELHASHFLLINIEFFSCINSRNSVPSSFFISYPKTCELCNVLEWLSV